MAAENLGFVSGDRLTVTRRAPSALGPAERNGIADGLSRASSGRRPLRARRRPRQFRRRCASSGRSSRARRRPRRFRRRCASSGRSSRARGARFRRTRTAFRRLHSAVRRDRRRRPGGDSPRSPSQLPRSQQSPPRSQAHHEPRRTPGPRGRHRPYGTDAEAE